MEALIDKAIEVVKGKIPALTVQDDMQKASQAVLNLKQAKKLYAGFNKPTKDMDEELAFVLGRVRPNLGATDLMKVTQAVLNLMHAKAVSETAKQPLKTTKATSK